MVDVKAIIIALDVEHNAMANGLYDSKQISTTKAIVGELFVWFVRWVKNPNLPLHFSFLVPILFLSLFLYLSTAAKHLWYTTTRLVLSHLSTLV